MAEPFLSEIRIMSFGFAPKGWALCNGQLLPINQNQALFSLLGTTYGGDGRVNFGLPNLQGRVPIHMGAGHTLGERGGEQAHTLSISEMPHARSHGVRVPQVGQHERGHAEPGNATRKSAVEAYAPPRGPHEPGPDRRSSTVGGSQAHLNMQPFLTLNFCIALQGIFPCQN